MFDAERRARCKAALARDLAATVTAPQARQRFLADAAHHARALPGSLAETLLIRR